MTGRRERDGAVLQKQDSGMTIEEVQTATSWPMGCQKAVAWSDPFLLDPFTGSCMIIRDFHSHQQPNPTKTNSHHIGKRLVMLKANHFHFSQTASLQNCFVFFSYLTTTLPY